MTTTRSISRKRSVPDLSIEVDDVDGGVHRFYLRNPFGKLANILVQVGAS